MAEQDDVLHLIDDTGSAPETSTTRKWKVAVIDDDQAVHEGTRFALIPGGRVIASAASSRPIDLPGLPRAFRYTDFVKAGDFLIVTWEEVSFTNVGRAGLLQYRLRP